MLENEFVDFISESPFESVNGMRRKLKVEFGSMSCVENWKEPSSLNVAVTIFSSSLILATKVVLKANLDEFY